MSSDASQYLEFLTEIYVTARKPLHAMQDMYVEYWNSLWKEHAECGVSPFNSTGPEYDVPSNPCRWR